MTNQCKVIKLSVQMDGIAAHGSNAGAWRRCASRNKCVERVVNYSEMSGWLVEKSACEIWMTESSNSSPRSVTVTSLISTPEEIQTCFVPIILMLSCCSSVIPGVASPSWGCSPGLSSALGGACPCCHLSWEGTEPLPGLWAGDTAGQCWRAWAWSVYPR